MEDRPSQRATLSLAAARSRKLLWVALVFSVFTNLLMLTGPLFMLQVYDRVLSSRSEETLVALFGLVTMLFLIYGILDYARGRVAARIGARVHSAFGPRVFRALLEASALKKTFGDKRPGLQDLEAIRTFFSSPLLLAIFDLPWTPVFLLAIFVFHPLLGWLAVAGGGVLVVAAVTNQLLTFRKTGQSQMVSQAANRFAGQVYGMSELAWSQGMGAVLERRWRGLQNRALDMAIAANDWTGGFTSFGKSFRFFLQSAMLALGAWLVLQNDLTAGAMIASSILLGRALAPVEQCIPHWPLAQKAGQSWRNLQNMLQAMPDSELPAQLPKPVAMLTAKGVTVYAASREEPTLSNVSFQVAPGEVLGILGRSGSGKSTLAKVLMGLTTPAIGDVRLGGATLAQYGTDRLGDLVGYLPQNIQFFEGTIAENIAHMSLEPSSQEVVLAAQKARVHDVILELEDGYNTRIGPSDAKLSGGQKQRLALARALYGDPVLLVLDEPNSALDKEGSEALNAAVNDMKAAKNSVVLMTHRPVSLSVCDKLLVIERGEVKSYGPRDNVINSTLKNSNAVRRDLKPVQRNIFRPSSSNEFRSIRRKNLRPVPGENFAALHERS